MAEKAMKVESIKVNSPRHENKSNPFRQKNHHKKQDGLFYKIYETMFPC